MNKEKKREYSRNRNERVKAERLVADREAEIARIAGIKDLEANKVVYRVKGSNVNYSSYIKAELSTQEIVEINRTVLTS
tara:strand:+ start:146 stop:382 length:237 start_codon:yes stop_codon:yes gene_type:complete